MPARRVDVPELPCSPSGGPNRSIVAATPSSANGSSDLPARCREVDIFGSGGEVDRRTRLQPELRAVSDDGAIDVAALRSRP